MQKFLTVIVFLINLNCDGQFVFKEPPKIIKPGVDLNSIKTKRSALKIDSVHTHNLKISAVGDIMLGTQYPSEKYLPGIDYLVYKQGSTLRSPNFFDRVKPYFQQQQIVFGNIEGTFFDSIGTVKNCSDSSKCYAFKQPTHYAKSLSDAGFNLVSVGNNHIGDFGISGIQSTHKVLKKEGIYNAGTNYRTVEYLEINGRKIGFLALAVGEDCVQIFDTNRIKSLLFELNQFCDVIIVSIHAGAEGNKYTHVTKNTEYYLNENRGNIFETAHFCIDHGADLILGHGPHVPRALELYQQKLIAYSLGNFCTYSRFNLSNNNGIAPILSIELNLLGNPVSIDIESYKQINEGGPTRDWRHRAKHRIKKLSKQDFPESYKQLKKIIH